MQPVASEARDAAGLAARIKRALHDEIGPILTCSIGISVNELLAKIAAEMDKPDGFVLLDHADLPGRLFDLELRDLPGISKGMEARLNVAGVSDIRGLWGLAPKHARAIWNSVEGERFVRRCMATRWKSRRRSNACSAMAATCRRTGARRKRCCNAPGC